MIAIAAQAQAQAQAQTQAVATATAAKAAQKIQLEKRKVHLQHHLKVAAVAAVVHRAKEKRLLKTLKSHLINLQILNN